MEEFTNFNTVDIIKLIVASSGFLILISRFKEEFTDKKRRQNLKIDLEILEKVTNIDKLENKHIHSQVKKEISHIYDKENYESLGLSSFLTSLIMTFGFSIWTISIFQNNDTFNPWSILTMLLACIGFSGLFDLNKKRKKKGAFFKVEFHDKENFMIAFYMVVIGSIILSVLLFMYDKKFNWGIFTASLFAFIGAVTIVRNTKLKKLL